MAISLDLRELAIKLEKSSDDLLVNASLKSPEVFEKVATAVAAASTLLEDVADDMDANSDYRMTEKQWDETVATIKAFRETGDEFLKKHASAMEEILLSIGAQKNAASQARKVTEDEINRLRAERRRSRMEEAYVKPGEAHHDMWNSVAQAKAVEQQVKRYVPMEAPLQTRYPPDRPGGHMTRITDHVYQDITTGIIYDYKAGYTTQKGNKIPGGSVEDQTRQLGDYRNQGSSLFETRESLMGRYAAEDPEHLQKIATAIKAVRDNAPEMMNEALDHAYDAGCSTDVVASIIADQTKTAENLKDSLIAVGWSDMLGDSSHESKIALALNAIQELAPHLLKGGIENAKKAGLTDKQIKSIIAGAFRSNFNAPLGKEGEIRAANILIPQLKALGWNNLVNDHIKVLAKMGISGLTKFASPIKKKSSLHQLKQVLSGFDRNIKDWGRCYRPSTEDNLRALLKNANVQSDDEEFRQRLVSQYQKGEIDLETLNDMLSDLDLEPYNEAGPQQPQQETTQPAPEQTEVSQEAGEMELGVPSSSSLLEELFGEELKQLQIMTPLTDLDGWEKIMNDSKQSISSRDDVKRNMLEIFKTKGRDAAHEYVEGLINQDMRSRNAVGAYEKDDNGDHWFIVAKEQRRLAGGPVTPKPSLPSSPKVEPKVEQKVEAPKAKRDKSGERATNDGKKFDWESYQDKNNLHISNREVLEIEQQWKLLYNDVSAAFDSVFSEFEFKGTKIPRSIEALPKWVKQYLKTLYVRTDNTQSVIAALREWLPEAVDEFEGDQLEEEYYEDILGKAAQLRAEAKTLRAAGKTEEAKARKKDADKKEKDALADKNSGKLRKAVVKKRVDELIPPANDLKDARKSLVERNDLEEADRLRKKALGKARAAAINMLLEDEGFPPMYPGADDAEIMTKVEFEQQLAQLGKRRDVIREERNQKRYQRRNVQNDVVNPVPEDKDGNPLITIVSDQDAYIKKLLEAFELFPNEFFKDPAKNKEFPTKNLNREIREERGEWMESQGFADPEYKLYGGSGNAYTMLSGLLSPISGTDNRAGLLDYATIDEDGNKTFSIFSDPRMKIEDLIEEDEEAGKYVVSIKVGDKDKEIEVNDDQLVEDGRGNILGIKLKNIFDNPNEYATHYREGHEQFAKKEDFSLPSMGRLNRLKKALGIPVPNGASIEDKDDAYTQAWLEIHGRIPPELVNLPDEIQLAIRALYEDRPSSEMSADEKKEEAKKVMQGMKWNGRDLPRYPGFEGGVPPKYVDLMWNSMKSTGDAIRRDIAGAFRNGKSVEHVKNKIEKNPNYEGAYIPEGILEFAEEFFSTQAQNNTKVKNDWDNFSLSNGFYPLHHYAVGKSSTRDLLRGWAPRHRGDKFVGQHGRISPKKPTGRKN